MPRVSPVAALRPVFPSTSHQPTGLFRSRNVCKVSSIENHLLCMRMANGNTFPIFLHFPRKREPFSSDSCRSDAFMSVSGCAVW